MVAGNAGGTSVLGLAALVNITGAEAATDRLTVSTRRRRRRGRLGPVGRSILLTADGGDGDDILIGGQAATCSSVAQATTS